MLSTLIGLVLSLFVGETIVYAQESPLIVDEPKVVLIEIKKNDLQKEEIEEKVYSIAREYGVDGDAMWHTILNESGASTTIQSRYKRSYPDGTVLAGDTTREQSFGLAQIHLPAHNVSYEEAIDPEFAIRFMAENFQKGRQSMWMGYSE